MKAAILPPPPVIATVTVQAANVESSTSRQFTPARTLASGTLLRYRQHSLAVVEVASRAGETFARPRRAWVETLYRRADASTFFLVRESWAGWMGDEHRRRHRFRVRQLGGLAAMIWKVGLLHRDFDRAEIKQARALRSLCQRQSWNEQFGVSPAGPAGNDLAYELLGLAWLSGPASAQTCQLAAVLGVLAARKGGAL